MTFKPPLTDHGALGYIGAHVALLAGAISLIFLQGYIWQLRIIQQGFGPYQPISYLTVLSVIMTLIDLPILWWGVKGSRTNRIASLIWPALFFSIALFVIVANNA